MSDRVAPHLYHVMKVNHITHKFYIARYGTQSVKPMSYDVAETRIAGEKADAGSEFKLISVEEFNRRFERKG